MRWILLAVAVGGAAPTGHVFIVAPEAAISSYPASEGLNAGGFGGFVHHDFFFRHDFSYPA